MSSHYDDVSFESPGSHGGALVAVVLVLAVMVYTIRFVCWLVVALYHWVVTDHLLRRDEELATALLDSCDTEEAPILLVGEDEGPKALPSGRRGRRQYMMEVVSNVKIVLGTPSRNAANIIVARRMARQLMESHGLRPTHIALILPMVVEAVFVESQHEHAARAWGERVRDRRTGWFGRCEAAEPLF